MCVRDGVGVHAFLTQKYKGTSTTHPYHREAFPGAYFLNRYPKAHEAFVKSEVVAQIERGCLVPWQGIRGPTGSASTADSSSLNRAVKI